MLYLLKPGILKSGTFVRLLSFSPKPIIPKHISPKMIFLSPTTFSLQKSSSTSEARFCAEPKTLDRLENSFSNQKWTYCNICIRTRKLPVFPYKTLIFDPFPSDFVFEVAGASLRLIKPFSKA